MTAPPTKRCSRCGESKRLGEFRRRPAARDGRTSACRSCENAARRERDRRAAAARHRELEPNFWRPGFANHRKPRAPRTDAKTLDELLEAW